MMSAVNMKHLARQLNLSTSTVSRALNDSYEVSFQTREKVMKLAGKLNYQPNPCASSLRGRPSKTIAVIVPELANNFFALAIQGIQTAARESGYHLLIYITNENGKVESEALRYLQNGRVDGLLISASPEGASDKNLLLFHRHAKPVVFFNRISDMFDTAKVTTDDIESSFKGTEHLIQQGCRKIAFLQISKEKSIAMNRIQGYVEALKKYNIEPEKKLIINYENDRKINYKLIKALLNKTSRPDAIFASVEHLAITSYFVCRDLKLSIPKDVKIISFSNMETASLLNPSLTTITQPAFDIGKAAANILLKALTKKSFNLSNCKIVLPSKLIQRESTARF